jgi:hypothetical protein
VDKDRALQFSLLGTLRLDDKSETALRVDEKSEKGYRIEVGKDSKSKVKPVTFDRFLAEVKPTNDQKRIIDSMLELTGRRIESSVLIGENNTMVIAPDLPRLNRMMVTNIASCLEPPQRVRFERLLEVNNAPYTVRERSMPAAKGGCLYQNIPKAPCNDQFFVITPDTMIYSKIHIDFDSLRRRMEEDFVAMQLRREEMLKRIMAREFQHARRNITLPPVQTFGNEEFFSVDINLPSEEIEQQQMRVVIQPRVRKQILVPGAQGRSIQIREWKDTSTENLTPQQ